MLARLRQKLDPTFRENRKPIAIAGFTLLELMLTMTLLGMVVVVISVALRLGLGAWEKGEKKVEGIQGPRIALDLLKRQISSALPYQVKKGSKAFFVFNGANKRLEFVTLAAISPQQKAGILYVRYFIEAEDEGTEHISFFEKDIILIDPLAETNFEDPEKWPQLIHGQKNISFKYTGKPKPDGLIDWEETWDAKVRGKMPSAVKLSFESESESAPIDLIVRLPSEEM